MEPRKEPPLHPTHDVTQLLHELSSGNREVLHELMPLVYDELSAMAHERLRYERGDHTLDTSALVHEAYLRLADQRRVHWQSRAHFYAIAAQAMRRILVNYSEKRAAQKRGGKSRDLVLDQVAASLAVGGDASPDLLDLNAALDRLESFNERGSRVVEYRFFGGMTHEEIAEVMGTSPVTVRRAWTSARLWLRRELQGSAGLG